MLDELKLIQLLGRYLPDDIAYLLEENGPLRTSKRIHSHLRRRVHMCLLYCLSCEEFENSQNELNRLLGCLDELYINTEDRLSYILFVAYSYQALKSLYNPNSFYSRVFAAIKHMDNIFSLEISEKIIVEGSVTYDEFMACLLNKLQDIPVVFIEELISYRKIEGYTFLD